MNSSPQKRSKLRWLGIAALAGGILIPVLAGVIYVSLSSINLGGLAARYAQKSLGRDVRIARLHVTPGRWLKVEIDGLTVANLPNGRAPDMVALQHLDMEISVLTVLHGPLLLRHSSTSGLKVLIERLPDGTANWKFHPQASKSEGPDDRKDFPTLLDMAVKDADIVFRNTRGKSFRTQLEHVTIQTTAANQPVLMKAVGAYNGTPITLEAQMQSTNVFRNMAQPYGVDLLARSGDLSLAFKGTLTDPLNVDGAKGALSLGTPTSQPIFQIAGMKDARSVAVDLQGLFEHKGDVWRLSDISGSLQKDTLTAGSLRLTEGARGHADDVGVDLSFQSLDLNRLMPRTGGAGENGETDIPLSVVRAPDPTMQVRLAAQNLTYNQFLFSQVLLEASVVPGRIGVDAFALTYLGASLRSKGEITADEDQANITADIDVNGADINRFSKVLGFRAMPVKGRLDARLIASAKQKSLNASFRGANVTAAVSMKDGQISRKAIQMASTNVMALFQNSEEMIPVSCFLGVVDAQAGRGSILPLRIKSSQGTISGSARFDLNRKWFELVFRSRPSTTSSFALDVPVRVSGTFSNPQLGLASLSEHGRALLAQLSQKTPIPPAVQRLAQNNACTQ